jgi:hypothetical protein
MLDNTYTVSKLGTYTPFCKYDLHYSKFVTYTSLYKYSLTSVCVVFWASKDVHSRYPYEVEVLLTFNIRSAFLTNNDFFLIELS